MENDLIHTEIRREPDDRLSFAQRVQLDYPSYVPKGLIRYPPKWAKTLIERRTTFVEFVQAVGEAARQAQTRVQRRNVLRVVEQLALSDEGRQTIDRILTPRFIHWLTAITVPPRLAFFAPPIIVYENANSPGKWAWLGSFEDEDVWPVAMLQMVTLDQAISAVWQDNYRPFVELFLFDGPDLQGRLLRIVRVSTEVTQLQLVLAGSLNDGCRSLLGSVRSIPGRRFSARQELDAGVTLVFSEWLTQSGVAQFGTASLAEPPRYTWDGYKQWLNSGGGFPPLPKTAALRIHLVIRIDDVLYGTATATCVIDTMLKRTGGLTPVQWVSQQSLPSIPDPWRGDIPPAGQARWDYYIGQILGLNLSNLCAQHIGVLAGTSPGSMRILPGRSTAVPTPPVTHWGLIELGQTDDDATIVLSP